MMITPQLSCGWKKEIVMEIERKLLELMPNPFLKCGWTRRGN